MKKKKKSQEEHEIQAEDQPDFDWGAESESDDVESLEINEAGEVEGSLSEGDEQSDLQSELEEIRSQAEEYLDGWQRARAEFANYKKRIQKESEESRSFITAEIMSKYITVVDDFERALSDRPSDGASDAWAEGVDMIYRKLKTILESEGVEEFSPEGEIFDPNFHEAIGFEESDDHDEGMIFQVIQPGYKIGERVIRPAIVRVAK
ncbi:MAG: nucleotide exchange factor GrpE [Anaerolineales bacterium]